MTIEISFKSRFTENLRFMITENRKRIKRILEWLKAELESHYKFQKSVLTPHRAMNMGKTSYRFDFESSEISLEIWYWNTGVINMAAFDMVSNDLFMNYVFMPDDWATNNYSEKAEATFRRKIKELLIGLHHKIAISR